MKKSQISLGVKFCIGILILAAGCFLPCPAGLTRQGAKYLGILVCMIFYLLVNLCEEYLIILFSLGACAFLQVENFTGIFSAFSNTTVWLLIGVLPFSMMIARSGLLRRIALHVLRLFPDTYYGQLLALSVAGVVISPCIPSITAKASILSPFSLQVAEEMHFPPKSREQMGLFMAVYFMGAVTGHIFYSGSMNVFILLGLLPEELQQSFSWGSWLSATWVWGLCIYVLGFLAMMVLYRPSVSTKEKKQSSAIGDKLKELGPMSGEEKKTAFILILTLFGWITRSLHGIPEAAIGLIAFFALALLCGVKKAEFRGKVAWDMILFIGGLMSMSTIMTNLGVDTWVADLLAPLIRPMLVSQEVFLLVLALLVFVSRYFIVSAISAVSLFYIIFAGPGQSIGISPWVTAFVIVSVGQLWSTAYNSTTYLTSVAVVGEENLDFKQAVKMSHVYVLLCILGFAFSFPLWRHLGLL